jgi:hypothetical protein
VVIGEEIRHVEELEIIHKKVAKKQIQELLEAKQVKVEFHDKPKKAENH